MDYLDFVDQVLDDFLLYFDDHPVGCIQDRLAEIEDGGLSFDEYRSAILSLRLAALMDPSKKEEREVVCEDFARLRHQGHLYAQTTIIDHDKLGRAAWEAMTIRDDAGELCDIHYNDVADNGPFVHIFGYMKAEEKDTANFLLSARVETCLNLMDAREMAA